jgi:NADH-quinone oxidoreductase subunit J
MLHIALFTIFAILCLGGAINLLIQRHPINAALSLIAVMGSLAMLYLLLGAEFVAAVQVIVYAGAIMVLFVFVIMLLNAGEEERVGKSTAALVLGIPGALAVTGLIVWSLLRHSQEPISMTEFHTTTKQLAASLFTEFLLPFEVTSVLILIAIMGAVITARKEHP